MPFFHQNTVKPGSYKPLQQNDMTREAEQYGAFCAYGPVALEALEAFQTTRKGAKGWSRALSNEGKELFATAVGGSNTRGNEDLDQDGNFQVSLVKLNGSHMATVSIPKSYTVAELLHVLQLSSTSVLQLPSARRFLQSGDALIEHGLPQELLVVPRNHTVLSVAEQTGVDAKEVSKSHLDSFCAGYSYFDGALSLDGCKALRGDDLMCLERCQEIHALSLRDCQMGWSAASALSRLIQHSNLSSLAKLKLCGNGLGDDGAEIISIILQRSRGISHIDLSNNEISSIGAAHLADALHHGIGLTDLILAHNRIGEAVRDGFPGDTSKMWHWRSDARGVTALSTSIPLSRTLRHLNLAGNALGLQKQVLQAACARALPLREVRLVI
jgi:hypothetical protein